LAGFDLAGPDVFGVAFTRLPLDRLNQENQKSRPSACHIQYLYQILWLCGGCRDD
jgi:hypothetical protein